MRTLISALFSIMLGSMKAEAAPSCGKAVYTGGPVISNVQVVEVYWTGGVVQAVKDYLPPFFAAITASSYLDWLYEYDLPKQFIGRGRLDGTYTITPSTTDMSLTDSQINAELASQIRVGNLPAPSLDGAGNVNTLYSIDFPPGYIIHLDGNSSSCSQFCSYYNSAMMSGFQIPYAVFPDLSVGACTTGCGTGSVVANVGTQHSLELLNAISGPDIGAGMLGWYSDNCGAIGNMCAGATMTVAGYPVAEGWSNRLNACVVGAPATPPPCVSQKPSSSDCRGCTASDEGAACPVGTPHCDTNPTDVTFGQCIAIPAVDAGSDGSRDAAKDASRDVPKDAGRDTAKDASRDLAKDAGRDSSQGDRSGSTTGACVPGQQVSCACIGGSAGAQICLSTGGGYSACACPDGSASSTRGAGNAPSSAKSGCGCQTGAGRPDTSLVIGAVLMIGLCAARRRRSGDKSISRASTDERDIALAVLRGDANEIIARDRHTSIRTVANQIAAIFAKLGVNSRIELAFAVDKSGAGDAEQ